MMSSTIVPTPISCRPAVAGGAVLLGVLFSTVASAQPQQGAPGVPQPQVRDRAFLGLQTEDIGDPAEKKGIRVSYIFPHSAAATMGFQLGDEVVALNDVFIDNRAGFIKEVRNNNINGKLRFLIRRSGESMKLTGKIGSYRKTMEAYQGELRKQYAGKPLPTPPSALWWNAKTSAWEEKDHAAAFAGTKDKVSIVFCIDDCKFCMQKKLTKLATMQRVLKQSQADAPVAFVGYFYADGRPLDAAKKAAETVLKSTPLDFPFALTFYPEGSKPDRDRQALLHMHGVSVLNHKGTVDFLQVFGEPEREFFEAYKKALTAITPPSGSGTAPTPPKPGKGS